MSMKALADADQRLIILRSLIDLSGTANESVLHECVQSYGHVTATRNVIQAHLRFLDEQRLVKLRDMLGCLVATITGAGEDVAAGRVTVKGVKKPRAADYE